MKDFFKIYGLLELIILSTILFIASTVGIVVMSIVLCIIHKTGWYALLNFILLATIPFWWCIVQVIKGAL